MNEVTSKIYKSSKAKEHAPPETTDQQDTDELITVVLPIINNS